MTIERLTPRTREEWLAGRKATIGASELPALFCVHDFMTPFELFAVKSGAYAKDFAETKIEADAIHIPPTERGNLFEDDAFELVQRLRPDWKITPNQIPGGSVFVDRAARMSATPDAFVEIPGRPGCGTIQVKTLNDHSFGERWKIDGAIEPPLSTAVQTNADASLSGCDYAYAAAMVIGYSTSLYLVEVPLRAKLMAKARELVSDFWRRIEAGEQYPPDFARDGKVIAEIYGTDDGGSIDLSANPRVRDILTAREAFKAREADGNAAEKERKILDAEIIAMLGNAANGIVGDGRIVSAKTIKRGAYSVAASQYRQVRIKDSGGKPSRAAAIDTSGPF